MFWDKFCALCASKGKAPNVVASEIGIKSSGTVTGWKNGAIPRLSVLHKISEYFDVPVESLTNESEQKEKPATTMGDELTRDRIKLLLPKMSVSDLQALMSELAAEMAGRAKE